MRNWWEKKNKMPQPAWRIRANWRASGVDKCWIAQLHATIYYNEVQNVKQAPELYH